MVMGENIVPSRGTLWNIDFLLNSFKQSLIVYPIGVCINGTTHLLLKSKDTIHYTSQAAVEAFFPTANRPGVTRRFRGY
ncbi:hypothetical protein CEXT_393361 [Caerostris extrusa]|uniref:Uncharacterized protein n=1 Tax=Caerostris extrusa TaxID=172846 RepID=A0AAV4NXL0_CAEEX|nr:hypothetical protein CEXT_393361 [Caerostris extrusa]